MIESSKPSVQIDLNEFKLHLYFKNKNQLTFHFNSPSRKFYLALIALVLNEMKKLGKIKSIPLQEHLDLLVLLNETVGGAAGSSDRQSLLQRIYRKWKDALPNLEEAPLFRVLGKKKAEGDGVSGKIYPFSDAEKDGWANLFEYMGSNENVRLKFAIDKIGAGLNETLIIFGEFRNGEAWDQFISDLKNANKEEQGEPEQTEEGAVPENPEVSFSSPPERKTPLFTRYRWILLMVMVGILGGAVWKIFFSPPSVELASVERMKFPLPAKPSLAVLPFVNMSEDPKQEYFSDGITEDLITDLSKISGLLVIARNSTFPYKGKPVPIKQVAEDLGVRYILEGSVRKAGEDIRINAQLIDALTGHHLWAERYDGKTAKIFALQDQITQKIVNALAVKLTGKEKEQLGEKGTENIAAHDEFLKGWGHYFRLTPDDFAKANSSFRKAVELDPNFDRAHAALALLHWTATQHPALRPGLGMSWMEARLRPRDFLQKAMRKPTSIAYNVSAQMNLYRRQHEMALSEIEKALSLDPNDPSSLQTMAFILNMTGRPKDATAFIERGMRLDPHNPSRYLWLLGWTHFNREDFAGAANSIEKAVRLNPENAGIKMQLGAFYGLLGRDREAREAVDACRKVIHVGDVAWNMFFYPFTNRKNADRYAEGLMKAGVPPGKAAGGYFPAFKDNQMNGEQIKSLLFDAKMAGIAPDGYHSYEPWWCKSKSNGEFAWRGAGEITSDTGRSRIEGDLICNQYQKRLWGIENCGTVFRNPGGTYEGKDEYIICWDTGFSRLSVTR
jgi:TolB-like protein